ncbi:replication/maintenance protein RepL [Mucilaginibacter sp.]|uniref:replication/maintenance protein RepL n=1 Tax=Mucilaginibacter sp. TaxID=1882438 RepID=UPI00374CF28A
MAELASTKGETVAYEEWVNKNTGEVRTFAVVSKETGDHSFHKVWLEDLARILGLLGGAKIEVFTYILKNINPYSNEFGGTVREIAEKTGIDANTVQKTIKVLRENDFLKKVRTGTYLVNSKMLVQGSHSKRVGILVKYNGLEE